MVNKTLNNGDNTYVGSNNDDVIYGLGGDDSIFGANGDDQIYGGDGNDTLRAGLGNDSLYGGSGNDILTLFKGNEVFDGGGGIDFIDFYYTTKGITIDLAEDVTNFTIGSKTYQVAYTGIEAVYGSSHNDKLTGDGKQNLLRGEDGNDRILGLGDDDFISGGNGKDVLIGGAGKDAFLFGHEPDGRKNFDQVMDFTAGTDRVGFNGTIFDVDGAGKTSHFRDIDYRTLDADQFQSGQGHVAANADIRVIYDASDGILYYDANGSKSGGLGEIADLGENLDLSADSIFVYGL
ncbi:MAG: hemolysin-type calcium-binding repeat family protein [Rhizobium sp.]|nr:hemolysin-type calcium-binding repeat family protein [Rhizobium sp.]